jgi:hypothetical protein
MTGLFSRQEIISACQQQKSGPGRDLTPKLTGLLTIGLIVILTLTCETVVIT